MNHQVFLLCALLTSTALARPSDELLAYWDLDQNLLDSAPSGTSDDHGSWVGSSRFSATNSQFGSALSLDGSRHVSIPSSDDLAHPGASLSLSVWCRVDNWNTTWQCLLAKGEGSNYRIARWSNDAQAISYAGGSPDIFGGAINDGAWHHIMAVSEAGENTALYVDGELVATGAAPSLTDSGAPLLLGENPQATGRRWQGGIDDVALFGEALGERQVTAIHHFGTVYGYPMAEVIRIFDAHHQEGTVSLGEETWSYLASDPGSGTFVVLGSNGSGVDVSTGPSITRFESSPIFISSGGRATLSWEVAPPLTGLTIDPGIGDVLGLTDASGGGQIEIAPTESTTYTLTASNADGSTPRSTTLFVDIDPSTPRINEFVADNSPEGLRDEDGSTEDWIEIFNPGPNAADLSTFHLTDDPTLPNKWTFPSLTMAPETYLVVFASSKDRTVAGAELHTNFSLAAGGEYLALTRSDGNGGFVTVEEFAPSYPRQEEGFSYGLAPDGLTRGYLENPTPEATNGPVSAGFVADTTFDIDRGFFEAPFDLTIASATPGAEIRYTTDGSRPTRSHGEIYRGPIPIATTTTIRAAAFKEGFFETNVDTQTYFFLEDVRTQYADGAAPAGWPSSSVNGQVFNYGMDPEITSRYSREEMIEALAAIPSVSLTMEQDDLTGSGSQGIYVNPGRRGRSWERPASFELIHPDGTTGNVQSNCGLRIRGGFSRSTSNPKHAFRLFFRREYGDGKLRYPLFGAEGVEEFDKFDLRTSQNYSWAFQNSGTNTFLREVLGRDLQGSFGQPYTRSRYYHLYLNGVYWGLFMSQERAEANFGESYFGGDDENYDTIKSAGSSGGYTTEATDGTFAAGSDWNQLWDLARAQQSSPTTARFMEMQGRNPDGTRNPALPVYLDVDNLIDYHLIIGYTGNYDAPLSDFIGASNNWYAVRDRVRDELGFQFFVHDGEHTLGAGGRWGGANDRLNTSNGSGSRGDYQRSNPSFLHFDLAAGTDEYRLRFADRAHRVLFNEGLLTREQVLEHMEARRSTVADVIIAESARWGDSKRSNPFDESDWNRAVDSLTSVINSRRGEFLEHLRDANLYPALAAPAYRQHGGVVTAGTNIEAIVPTTGTHLYYLIGQGDTDESDWSDDLDPRLLGGGINPAASVLSITGDGEPGPVTTVYLAEGSVWKYLDDGSNQGTAWRAPAFDDRSWASGPAELGYGDGDEATIVASGPDNAKFPTTYFRKTIEIPEPSVFEDFELEITYDDAYVVYANGVEMARHRSLPSNPAFDLYANDVVGNNAVASLSIPPSAFVAGTNVIAVEIHQANSGSSDISFDLQLTGRPAGEGETVTLPLPDSIEEPVWVKARTYNATTQTWSALNEAYFSTAPAATSTDLVISEVHYHPTAPSPGELAVDPTFDQNDFEFIEILNIGSRTVDLGGVALVRIPVENTLEGVEFTFPSGSLLAPGDRQVVAAHQNAFAARYPGTAIAGVYQGRLSNGGEWITLVDREGVVIDRFRYGDVAPWPEAADGTGPSLVRVDPESDLDPTLGSHWLASLESGGSPGRSEGKTFTGDPLADRDHDGYVAIMEYAGGLSDDIPSAGEHLNLSVIEVGGARYPAVSYREDPAAVDAALELEMSSDLRAESWRAAAPDLILVGTATDPDGIPRHTYRLDRPLPETPRFFFRLKVSF